MEQWNGSVWWTLASVLSRYNSITIWSRDATRKWDDSVCSVRIFFKVKYFMRKWLLAERLKLPIKFIKCQKHLNGQFSIRRVVILLRSGEKWTNKEKNSSIIQELCCLFTAFGRKRFNVFVWASVYVSAFVYITEHTPSFYSYIHPLTSVSLYATFYGAFHILPCSSFLPSQTPNHKPK